MFALAILLAHAAASPLLDEDNSHNMSILAKTYTWKSTMSDTAGTTT
jgi:hypothetical protein